MLPDLPPAPIQTDPHPQVMVGDVVFIRVPARPFREVAQATLSWTNHVGVVVSTAGPQPVVAESTFPLSRMTTLSRFVSRSEAGRVAISRLPQGLTADQRERLYKAASARTGILYDTGFNLHSGRQFCSKYVREVLLAATGQELGEVESFRHLLGRNPQAELGFWQVWYFGRIPWQRQTVTPASLLHSPHLRVVFDGHMPQPAHL